MPARPTQDTLFARQLLRFSRTTASNVNIILSDDIDFAARLAPDADLRVGSLELDFPLEWIESRAKFSAFLRRWRLRQLEYQQDNFFQLDPDRPPSVTQSERAALNEPLDLHEQPHEHNPAPDIGAPAVGHALSGPLTHHHPDPFGHSFGPEPQDEPHHPFGADQSDQISSDHPASDIATGDSFHTPAPSLSGSAGNVSSHDSHTGITPSAHISPASASHSNTITNPLSSVTAHHPDSMADQRPVTPLSKEAATQLLRDAAATHNQNLAQILVTAQGLHRSGSSLRSQDVGYFDPSADDPTDSGIVADGKVTKFTDVFSFTERLQHLAKANSEDEVRRVWTQCLLGPALVWHSHILSATDRELLQTAPVGLICNKLIDRFKPSWTTAFAQLQAARLTLDDIHRGHDLQAFAQRVIRHAKNCDQSYVNQL